MKTIAQWIAAVLVTVVWAQGAVAQPALTFKLRVGSPTTFIVEGLQARVTTLRLARNGVEQDYPVTVAANGEASLPAQTFTTVGTYTMGVAACDAFGCSSMFPFVVDANTPPNPPTGTRLATAIASSLRDVAEALDAFAAEQAPAQTIRLRP